MKRRSFTDSPLEHCIAQRESVSTSLPGWAMFGPYKATSGERIALVPVLCVIAILAMALGVHLLA